MKVVDHYNCFAGEIYEHCKIYNAVLLGNDESEHCDNLIKFAGIPDGGVVLDVGCGSGGFLNRLMMGLIHRGIDPSDHQLCLARLNLGRHSNTLVFKSDMESFDNEGELYDTIFFNETIGYSKYRQREMINKYYHVLKAGGSLIISTFLNMDTINEKGEREENFEKNQEIFRSLGADSQLRNIDFFEYMGFDTEILIDRRVSFYDGEKQINQNWLEHRPSAGFMNVEVSEIIKKHITVKIFNP